MLRVALVSTGHEVLRGHTLNTDAAWLARSATEAGASVTSVRTVGDDVDDVVRALREAVAEAACVLVTGGLGPTEDDRTREALARLSGAPLRHDEEAWRGIEAWFARAGRVPRPVQRRQALLPQGATTLRNEEGTAPGVLLRVGACDVFLLPGPPREARAMFEREVLPRWRAAGALEGVALRVLWTAGVPEAEVAAPIERWMKAAEPVVGTHPDEGEVAVRILARGPGAAARADEVAAAVRRALGRHVVSETDDERVQHAVVRALADLGLQATTAESITGGLVARMLCEVPGASRVFRGGWVAYSDAWKARELGVSEAALAEHGAVSPVVAQAMAAGARARAGADVAVATTGVAGPGPDDRGVAEGTVHVAVALAGGVRVVSPPRVLGSRLAIQRRAAVQALCALRDALGAGPGGRG